MKLEKLIIGNFGYIAEAGKTIDGVEVGIAAYPDVDPIENWASVGCISETDFETETETDTDYCPSPGGGYMKEDDDTVVADIIKFKSRGHIEPFWRMLLGFKQEIVNGVAQIPFSEKRRYIQCWLKVQGRAQDGVDRVVMNVWGKLRIDENPKWSKDPTKPGYKFIVEYSDIATAEPNDIVAVVV